MSDWQPIETAPRDQRIMLYRPSTQYEWARVVFGKWEEESWHKKPRPYWGHDVDRLEGVTSTRKHQPTHWQPLPPPPTP